MVIPLEGGKRAGGGKPRLLNRELNAFSVKHRRGPSRLALARSGQWGRGAKKLRRAISERRRGSTRQRGKLSFEPLFVGQERNPSVVRREIGSDSDGRKLEQECSVTAVGAVHEAPANVEDRLFRALDDDLLSVGAHAGTAQHVKAFLADETERLALSCPVRRGLLRLRGATRLS